MSSFSVSDVSRLTVKDEGSTSWNAAASSAVSVAVLWWNLQLSLLSFAHLLETLVPTGYHLSNTDCDERRHMGKGETIVHRLVWKAPRADQSEEYAHV